MTKKVLLNWDSDPVLDLTLGKVYEINDLGYFQDDVGQRRPATLGEWADVPEKEPAVFFSDTPDIQYNPCEAVFEGKTEEHTGGSSSYYDIEIEGNTIRCLDLIEALGMSYNEGNIFKAVWRIAAAKQGKTKKGNNMHYDAEKIVFFGERLVQEHTDEG